nr:LytTR family DNA-binding domain-containing protein [uncultured Draconibacterium sp.]
MKILIIEDEKHTANRLISLLKNYQSDIEILDVLDSVKSAVNWFSAHRQPDLIFQDIELNDGQCFEIYQQIKTEAPIVFTTAYQQYALRAFELHSIDYLVKPYDKKDIKRVMEKFEKYGSIFRANEVSMMKLLMANKETPWKKRLLVRAGDMYKSLNVSDIAYFQSEDGLSFAYTEDNKRYPLDQTLNELNQALNPDDFFRVNRNCIVSHSCIVKVSAWFNSRLKLVLQPNSAEEVVVSRERVKDFKKWMGG